MNIMNAVRMHEVIDHPLYERNDLNNKQTITHYPLQIDFFFYEFPKNSFFLIAFLCSKYLNYDKPRSSIFRLH